MQDYNIVANRGSWFKLCFIQSQSLKTLTIKNYKLKAKQFKTKKYHSHINFKTRT